MDIWIQEGWKNIITDPSRRKGLRFRFDKTVNPEVREACLKFAHWLRCQYCFPLRIPVYVKGDAKIRTKDGDRAVGSFF